MIKELPRKLFVLTALASLIGGCSTFVTSKREDAKKTGFTYSLPIPALLATPKSDGTVKTEIVYLPDPQNRYYYKARSFISSYTLKVELENGNLLKSVSLDAKGGDVAVEAVKASGAIGKAAIDAEAANRAESEKEEKAILERVRLAQLAVEKAQAKADTLKELAGENPTAEQTAMIHAAKIELAIAKAERDAAVEGAPAVANSLLDAPETPDCAWGPVLYRIEMNENSVWLERMPFMDGANTIASANSGCGNVSNKQRQFSTSRVGIPPDTPTPAAKEPSFEFDGSRVLTQGDNSRYEFTLKVKDGPVGSIDAQSSVLSLTVAGGTNQRVNSIPTYTRQTDPERLTVSLPAGLGTGKYSLTFQYKYAGDTKDAVAEVEFEIP